MSRSTHEVSLEIVEVITVFDGSSSEVTGLVNGDFAKIVTKDGAVTAVTATVSEINAGTRPGEYKVSFTPDAVGQWRVRIEQSSGAAYNKRGWQATYDVIAAGGALTPSSIAAAVWASVLETGFSASRILRIIAAVLAGKSTGGRASLTARNLADTQNQVVGAADDQGNRTPSSYGA